MSSQALPTSAPQCGVLDMHSQAQLLYVGIRYSKTDLQANSQTPTLGTTLQQTIDFFFFLSNDEKIE